MQVNDRSKNQRSTGVVALICFVCQLALSSYLGMANGHPNFALIFSIVIALSMGGRVAVISGFVAGLVFDLSSTGPVGLMALLLSVSSYILGSEMRDRYSDEVKDTLLPAGGTILAVSVAYNLTMLVVGQSDSLIDALIFRSLPTALLTALCYAPFAVLAGRGHKGSLLSFSRNKASRFEMPK